MALKACPPSKPRSGLIGEVTFDLYPTLVTPLSAGLLGSASFGFSGEISPDVAFPNWAASGTLTLDNLDVLSANLVGRAAAIQNPNDQSEVAWFLDNIGGGVECCTSGGTGAEYTTVLSGLSFEIPRTTHGLAGSPNVVVLNPSGIEVSTTVAYIGDSVFISSNLPLDNHTAILR